MHELAQGAAAGTSTRSSSCQKDHPLFRQQFQIAKVPQIPSINFWMGSGGGTSERYDDSAVPHAMGDRRQARAA